MATLNKLTLEMDPNGNKVLKLGFKNANGFSVQTNGNLPFTHRIQIGCVPSQCIPEVVKEAWDYVKAYGTKKQQEKLVYGLTTD